MSGFLSEIGFYNLVNSPKDVYVIILLRMLRLVGFGATSLILALYLRELSFDDEYIGLFMTLTFVGDLVSSFLLALVADQIGRRNVLVISSAAMVCTGVVFSTFQNRIALTAAAVIGILTPSGGEVGPFRSIEQSSIASLVPAEHRSDIYAWYTFLGTFCAALGSVLCGKLVDWAQLSLDHTLLDSYRLAFGGYTVLAVILVILSLTISSGIEVGTPVPTTGVSVSSPNGGGETADAAEELTRLLPESAQPKKKKFSITSLFPSLLRSIVDIVVKLSLLFALDSFASSLVSTSWQSYYIKQKFHISASVLGSVFFATGIVSGFTSLLSTSLTKRLGPVVTMVATHLPASILLAMVPLPSSLYVTMAILVVRASTQSMDVAPKHVFLATLVPDSQRTAVFGWVNVVKTLAQVIGPSVVGVLSQHGALWVSFIVAGSLKVTYDLGILGTFLAYNRHHQH
jgi:MFS family permease